MTKIKKIFLIFLASLFFFSPHILLAAEDQYYGLEGAAKQAGLRSKSPEEVPTLIGNVIGSILALIGVIFFALMVYGGFLWMTAHGDSGQVDKGRETIIAAVIGMIIVISSYALTAFVMSAPGGGVTKPPSDVPISEGDTSKCTSHGEGFACNDIVNCQPATIVDNLCPGGQDIKCCQMLVQPAP